MARIPIYLPVRLSVSILVVLVGMEQFVDSQNICLFRQGNDISTAVSRTAYAECMAEKKYYLKDGCEAGATTATCYVHRP
jgi:hypothetical protein